MGNVDAVRNRMILSNRGRAVEKRTYVGLRQMEMRLATA